MRSNYPILRISQKKAIEIIAFIQQNNLLLLTMYYKSISFYKFKSQDYDLPKIRQTLLNRFQWTKHEIPKDQSYSVRNSVIKKNHSLYDRGLNIYERAPNSFRIQTLHGTVDMPGSNQMGYKFSVAQSQTDPIQMIQTLGYEKYRTIFQYAGQKLISNKYGVEVHFLAKWKYIRIIEVSQTPFDCGMEDGNSMNTLIYQAIKDLVNFNSGIDYMNMLPDDCKMLNDKEQKIVKIA